MSGIDVASQRGEPKPKFVTIKGDPIFTKEDDHWWLTDVQRKPNEPPPPGDEDGPAENDKDDVVDEVEEFTDDEDPPSSEAEPITENIENEKYKDYEEAESQPLERPPSLAWKRDANNHPDNAKICLDAAGSKISNTMMTQSTTASQETKYPMGNTASSSCGSFANDSIA